MNKWDELREIPRQQTSGEVVLNKRVKIMSLVYRTFQKIKMPPSILPVVMLREKMGWMTMGITHSRRGMTLSCRVVGLQGKALKRTQVLQPEIFGS